MKNSLLICLLSIAFAQTAYTQIAVGPGTPAPDPSAMLDVQSTSSGLLIPRVTAAQRAAIVSPATSLIVYQTDGVAGFYFNSGTPATPVWTALAAGAGSTGYIQNQVAADQAAGFRISGNGLFNGGQVTIGSAIPLANTLLTMNTSTAIANGIDMTVSGAAPSGRGINLTLSSANFNGMLVTHSSSSLVNSFYGIASFLTGTNIVSGYLGFRSSTGLTYGVYGVNGTNGTYATSASTWAAFLRGRTVISSEASPTSALGTDLEVRNTTIGAAAPATVSLRQTTALPATNDVLANLNFGDNNQTAPQAQLRVVRDAASVGATDLPTAITFSTTTDGTAVLSERMRIANNGNVGINQSSPDASAILDVNATNKGVLVPRVTAAQRAAIASPATSLIVYQTDATAGFYYNSGTPAVPVWTLLATGTGGTGYVQNQVVADQAAGFRINGNGLFNGGQVGVGTTAPDASAVVDIASTSRGILVPRVTAAQQAAIVNPATSLMLYQTDGTPGFYYNSGTPAAPVWTLLATGTGGSGYVQNQVAADQPAGFRINGNGLFNGGQVGIGTLTPDASALLDLTSTTKGFLISRMTAAQRIAIASPATGLMVYQTDGTAGFYYNSGTPGVPVWTIVTPGNGGTGYVQNQVATDQAAGFRINGNGILNGGQLVVNGGQAVIGNAAPDASALLDLTSTTKGLLISRMTAAQRSAIASPATGLTVYQTDGTAGFYYNSGTPATPVWTALAIASGGTGYIQNQVAADQTAGFRIDGNGIFSNGNVGIGTTVPGAKLDMQHTPGSSAPIARFTTYANGTTFDARRSGGTAAAPTIVSINNLLSRFQGWGYDGTSFRAAGSIDIWTDANVAPTAGTSMPGAIVFNTTAAAATAERMRIDRLGRVGINTSNPGMRLDVTDATSTTDDAVVRSISTGTTGRTYAVLGTSASTTTNATGVRGVSTASTGSVNGVWGESASASGSGVYGLATNGDGDGIFGFNNAVAGAGLGTGVYGQSRQWNGAGVWGDDLSSNAAGSGVVGTSALGNGVAGFGTGDGSWGVYGQNSSTGTGFAQIGILGEKTGATGTGTGYGIWGSASGSGSVNIGGYFTAFGATTNVALRLGASSSGFVNISPAATTTSYSLTLPSALPSVANSILSSSTTGVLSWTTVASLGSNFVDLSNTQTAAGAKTWSSLNTFNAGVAVTGTTSINVGSASNTDINTGASSGTVTIGGSATQTIGIGSNAAGQKSIIIGNTVAGSNVSLRAGPGAAVNVTGDLNLNTAGNKLRIASGANASIGTATLVAGTVTVNTTAVATGSVIIVTINTPGGTPGIVSVPSASIVNATSFTINSSSASDTSTVNWWIIN